MINPMIVMTTSISTRVKPASACRSARRLSDSTHSFIALLPFLSHRQSVRYRSAGGRDAKHFGRRTHSCSALFDRIVQHRGHTGANGGAIDQSCVGLGADQGSDFVSQFQQFKNSGAPAIAGAAAAFATRGAINRLAGRKTQKPITRIGDQILFSQDMLGLAAATEDADKPLRDDRAQRRAQKKSLE